MTDNDLKQRIGYCYETMQNRIKNNLNNESIFGAFKLFFRKELKELDLDAEYDVNKFEIIRNDETTTN